MKVDIEPLSFSDFTPSNAPLLEQNTFMVTTPLIAQQFEDNFFVTTPVIAQQFEDNFFVTTPVIAQQFEDNFFVTTPVIAQQFEDNFFAHSGEILGNFVESGQVWALLIGIVLGYAIRGITTY